LTARLDQVDINSNPSMKTKRSAWLIGLAAVAILAA
jgi:hypothetical protein